jgi:hypothetical protein
MTGLNRVIFENAVVNRAALALVRRKHSEFCNRDKLIYLIVTFKTKMKNLSIELPD